MYTAISTEDLYGGEQILPYICVMAIRSTVEGCGVRSDPKAYIQSYVIILQGPWKQFCGKEQGRAHR